jgi:hypothetical protein
LQYSAEVLSQEQSLLQHEMQRLLQLAPQSPAVAEHAVSRGQQQLADQAAPWDPLGQVSTVEQAAALEEELTRASILAGHKVARSASPKQDKRHRGGNRKHGLGRDDVSSSSTSTSSTSSGGPDARRGPIHPVLAQQQLFSVYVHSPDGVLLPSSSIFSGTELRVRLNTTQGYAQHVLAEAGVLLLRAALQDASNVHFVMVSDTSIPLYPPQVRARGHSKRLQDGSTTQQAARRMAQQIQLIFWLPHI